MDTNVNYTAVGLFVITLVSAIIVTVVWLSSGLSSEHFKTYKIYMKESVSGLNVDSVVEYNGVNVGKVKSIELNKSNPKLVEVLLSIKTSTPITRGTIATLTTRGITGVSYMALKDKGDNLKPLQTLPGESYPVIPTQPSLFLRLDTALTSLTTNLQKVTNAVNNLLDKDNLAAIHGTLQSLNEITGTFAKNSDQLTAIMQNTAAASKQLSPLLQSGQSTVRVFETQTMPATQQLMVNLQTTSQNLMDISKSLKQNPSIIIRGSAKPPLGPGEGR